MVYALRCCSSQRRFALSPHRAPRQSNKLTKIRIFWVHRPTNFRRPSNNLIHSSVVHSSVKSPSTNKTCSEKDVKNKSLLRIWRTCESILISMKSQKEQRKADKLANFIALSRYSRRFGGNQFSILQQKQFAIEIKYKNNNCFGEICVCSIIAA